MQFLKLPNGKKLPSFKKSDQNKQVEKPQSIN